MKEILSQIRLLYVEDDESIRTVLGRGLKRRVKEISIAVDGEDGLEKYKSFNPDIIVTDIKMPKMSGLEMSKEIRELDDTTPIIITSAHGESEVLLEAIEIGINGYILKPIEKDKLFDTISSYAKTKVLEEEIRKKDKLIVNQAKNAALGELIGNIAHQWRQPLSIISTTAGLIQLKDEMGDLNSEFILESVNRIVNTTKELSNTIEFFYNTSSIVNEKKVYFNIFDTIKKIIDNLTNDLDIDIITNIDDSMIIESFENLFIDIITKLLSNCIYVLKNIEFDRYIFIQIEIKDNNIIINIKDNAGGIDADIINKIFEPYFTTQHQSSGKGLGLYSVQVMVENGLEGSALVDNQTYTYNDKQYTGASFTIIIPI